MLCSLVLLCPLLCVLVQGWAPDFPSAVVHPSPNFNARRTAVSILVMHYTATKTAAEALQRLTDPAAEVSSHYLVYENGTVFQLVQEANRAWHAGVGAWRNVKSDVNSASIGIEIQNPGDLEGEPPFAAKQINSVIALAKSIVNRHKIRPENVVGHEDLTPGRKPDPGHRFPWKDLHTAGVGVWAQPAPIVSGHEIVEGDKGTAVRELQQQLNELGYDLAVDGDFGKRTKDVVIAFQKHWRQQLYDGKADNSTRETLDKVLKAASELTSQ